jgi:hydrogenase maturation protease
MRVLVAGLGNIFHGDDGFGVEVARRLEGVPMPDGTTVIDFGVRGVHLAFDLASGAYDAAILVDATSCGGPPGTLYVIDPAGSNVPAPDDAVADPHGMTPSVLLEWLTRLGGPGVRMRVVGCEPQCLDEVMGLSPPVSAAVSGAVALVQRLVGEMSPASG